MTDAQIPAGWYPDPAGDQTKIRYWDGQNWTDQTQDAQNPDLRTEAAAVPAQPLQPIYAPGQIIGGQAPGTTGPNRKGFAVAGLVLGILGIPTCCILVGALLGLMGLIFSILGLKSTRKGVAIAGIILSVIALVIGVGYIIYFIAIFPDIMNNPTNYGLPADYWEQYGL
jgi:hypothetical protein